MMTTDTIAAIATPYGKSAIGVIRFSGINTHKIIDKFIGHRLEPRFATNTKIIDEQSNVIDDVIAVYYKSPSSYTGEDMLEIQSHGNPAILGYILDCACKKLARVSKPGEFTERAFLNNKIDLTQAEAVADIINASNITASKAALITLQGKFSKDIHLLIERVLKIRADIEASIDFPEDDSPSISSKNNSKTLNQITADIETLLTSVRTGIVINEKPTISIAGKPNVGKSSLANYLLGQKGSIVSEIPGTTRDSLMHEVAVDKSIISIIDTAGLRETDDPLESEGIKASRKSFAASSLVLYMVDDQAGFDKDDEKLIKSNNITNYWIIHNKIDLTNNKQKIATNGKIRTFYISLLENIGVDLFKKELAERNLPIDETTGTARLRHLQELEYTLERLYKAIKYNDNQQLELVAEELRFAHQSLVAIVGGDINEDLLDKIFSDFCIGK